MLRVKNLERGRLYSDADVSDIVDGVSSASFSSGTASILSGLFCPKSHWQEVDCVLKNLGVSQSDSSEAQSSSVYKISKQPKIKEALAQLGEREKSAIIIQRTFRATRGDINMAKKLLQLNNSVDVYYKGLFPMLEMQHKMLRVQCFVVTPENLLRSSLVEQEGAGFAQIQNLSATTFALQSLAKCQAEESSARFVESVQELVERSSASRTFHEKCEESLRRAYFEQLEIQCGTSMLLQEESNSRVQVIVEFFFVVAAELDCSLRGQHEAWCGGAHTQLLLEERAASLFSSQLSCRQQLEREELESFGVSVMTADALFYVSYVSRCAEMCTKNTKLLEAETDEETQRAELLAQEWVVWADYPERYLRDCYAPFVYYQFLKDCADTLDSLSSSVMFAIQEDAIIALDELRLEFSSSARTLMCDQLQVRETESRNVLLISESEDFCRIFLLLESATGEAITLDEAEEFSSGIALPFHQGFKVSVVEVQQRRGVHNEEWGCRCDLLAQYLRACVQKEITQSECSERCSIVQFCESARRHVIQVEAQRGVLRCLCSIVVSREAATDIFAGESAERAELLSSFALSHKRIEFCDDYCTAVTHTLFPAFAQQVLEIAVIREESVEFSLLLAQEQKVQGQSERKHLFDLQLAARAKIVKQAVNEFGQNLLLNGKIPLFGCWMVKQSLLGLRNLAVTREQFDRHSIALQQASAAACILLPQYVEIVQRLTAMQERRERNTMRRLYGVHQDEKLLRQEIVSEEAKLFSDTVKVFNILSMSLYRPVRNRLVLPSEREIMRKKSRVQPKSKCVQVTKECTAPKLLDASLLEQSGLLMDVAERQARELQCVEDLTFLRILEEFHSPPSCHKASFVDDLFESQHSHARSDSEASKTPSAPSMERRGTRRKSSRRRSLFQAPRNLREMMTDVQAKEMLRRRKHRGALQLLQLSSAH